METSNTTTTTKSYSSQNGSPTTNLMLIEKIDEMIELGFSYDEAYAIATEASPELTVKSLFIKIGVNRGFSVQEAHTMHQMYVKLAATNYEKAYRIYLGRLAG